MPKLSCYQTENTLEAGVDEAGRGPAFGRIYAAAVIWPKDLDSNLVRDSKEIKKEADMKVSFDFVCNNAIDYGIGYASVEEIDRLGVGQANMVAMHRALDTLKLRPEQILVDGNYFQIYTDKKGNAINYGTVVGGDHKFYSIAAASILAKYSRDQYIKELCEEYPDLVARYDILRNKGYISAPKHKQGIEEFGITQFHRSSWKCCKEYPLTEVQPVPT